MRKQYICPVCKELNEEHRKYCKKCGTWLLDSNYPAKEIATDYTARKSSTQPSIRQRQNQVKSRTKILYIIGSAIFLIFMIPLLLMGNGDTLNSFSSIITLLGLVGMAISLLTLFIMLFSGNLQSSRNEFLILLGVSFISVIIGSISIGGEGNVPATTNNPELSLEVYRSTAEKIEYRDLARNANTYKGNNVQMKGTVVQLIDGEQEQIIVDVSGKGDRVFINRKDVAGNLLEKDKIEIYGIVNGFQSYKAWTGVKYTIPKLESEYILLK